MTGAETREAIRRAAARLFAESGYSGASVRDIAAAAGADPALVIRHFGSKEALFLESVDRAMPADLDLDGPLDDLGERLVRRLLEAQDQVRSTYLALLRASDSAAVGGRLREVHDRYFVEPLRAHLAGRDADRRARVAASLIGGMLYSLWVVEDEALASADRELLVRDYGSLVQLAITPRESGASTA